MRRIRSEDKKILQNAKQEATNHCLNELEIRAELLELKGKSNEAKLGKKIIKIFLKNSKKKFQKKILENFPKKAPKFSKNIF